jgi:acetolactate synthase-1/2/3 large subunit
MMAVAELETAARLRLPLLVVVFDDAALSLIQIKQEQRALEGTSMRYEGPDFSTLAGSFGIAARVAVDEWSFRDAVLSALASPGPTLIDARIDASGYRRTLEIVRGAPGPSA